MSVGLCARFYGLKLVAVTVAVAVTLGCGRGCCCGCGCGLWPVAYGCGLWLGACIVKLVAVVVVWAVAAAVT